MRILVIGGGGREHAIAWRLASEGHQVAGAPGNPGIGQIGVVLNTTDYLQAAREFEPDVTIVGPEAPLVAGVVDAFRGQGLPVVGPLREQARLEGSKIYAKQFMAEAGIPTAQAIEAESAEAALKALDRFDYPVVVKADGLAAGKGVVIAQDRAEAESAIRTLGDRLVIEEFLTGEEVSFIALSDGRAVLPLEATQDHKRLCDSDRGPNTGGMGAYCDGRILDEDTARLIINRIIGPVVERTGFTGFLYAGLMMTNNGPKVLEFNVRLGDPETQALMHRMGGGFGEALAAAASGSLTGCRFQWRPEPSVCVVLAAHGYPGQVRTGDPISGIEEAGTEVFHAGTRIGPRGLETAGGRVLGVTARAPDLDSAIRNTYLAVSRIRFDGMQYRTDIGRKGLQRW
jgi:phosphoribosylamine--glycine ligase